MVYISESNLYVGMRRTLLSRNTIKNLKTYQNTWIFLETLLCFWNGLLAIKYLSIVRTESGMEIDKTVFFVILFFFSKTTYMYNLTGKSEDRESLTKLFKSPMHRGFSQNELGI